MAIASGSRHSMGFVAESAFGVTPATPVFKNLRHTGTSLALTKEAIQSAELRSDRQISDYRGGNRSVAGDISAELSFGTFDDLIEAALCGSWSADVLKAGVERRSFTIERHFADIGERHRYTGCEINTLALSVAPNAVVTATFGILGSDYSIGTSPLTGATYEPATTTSPFDSFTGTIKEGGQDIAVVTSLELSLENGMEAMFVVGSNKTLEPSIGRSNLTGTLTAYFESKALLEKFINEDDSSLEFSLVDLDGNSYVFTLPRIRYTGGQPDVSGEGAITLSMPFQALLDPVSGTNIEIERIAA